MIDKRKLILVAIAAIAAVVLAGVATVAVTGAGSGTRVAASAPSSSSLTGCGTHSGRGCAPASKRVDTGTPSFSNSTEITNPPVPDHSALRRGR